MMSYKLRFLKIADVITRTDWSEHIIWFKLCKSWTNFVYENIRMNCWLQTKLFLLQLRSRNHFIVVAFMGSSFLIHHGIYHDLFVCP